MDEQTHPTDQTPAAPTAQSAEMEENGYASPPGANPENSDPVILDGEILDPEGDMPIFPEESEAERPPDRITELEMALAEAEDRVAEVTDKMQRAAAEFQNARRRQDRQLEENITRANQRLIERLLPVLDDFRLALQNVPDQVQTDDLSWIQGLEQIQKKLLDGLSEEGVTVIDDTGPFDPSRHEAISSEPSTEVESGHIIETLRAGYLHRDRVLRPALVRVAM